MNQVVEQLQLTVVVRTLGYIPRTNSVLNYVYTAQHRCIGMRIRLMRIHAVLLQVKVWKEQSAGLGPTDLGLLHSVDKPVDGHPWYIYLHF